MAAVMLPKLCNIQKNCVFFSANTYERNIASKKYFIAHYNAKMCSLPVCRFHIFLLGTVEEELHKLDPLCFTSQHLDCLYALFKYRFSGNIVVECVQVFENMQGPIQFNQRNRRRDRSAIIKKKRLSKKIYRETLMSFFE